MTSFRVFTLKILLYYYFNWDKVAQSIIVKEEVKENYGDIKSDKKTISFYQTKNI